MKKEKRILKDEEGASTMILKHIIQSEKISWGARGILVYLLSKKYTQGQKLVKSEIMKHGELRQGAFNTKWTELQQFGFITSENGNFLFVPEPKNMNSVNIPNLER